MTFLLIQSIYLLVLGLGILIMRRNFIFYLLSIEILTLGINLFCVHASLILDNITGILISVYLLTLAGLESAIGLALLTNFHKLRGTISITEMRNVTNIKG